MATAVRSGLGSGLPATFGLGVVVAVLAVLVLSTGESETASSSPPTVLVARVSGPITPVVADHVASGVATAERSGHGAFLIELDTPGGLVTSMQDITKTFLNAKVPVIVFVAPSGARAASAGAIITLAAHIAAMAPGTNIGAATPVDLQGGEVGDKVVNDAAAYAAAVAAQRGRSQDFATAAVREGRSVPAHEAQELGAVDLVTNDRATLLESLNGRTVQVAGERSVVLHTRGIALVDHEMGPFRGLLQMLSHPNVVLALLGLGVLGILYELSNPGVGMGGIVGVISILLAALGLALLPVNLVGVLLLILAGGLFVAELFAPGIGVFAVGGAASMVLGGILLLDGPLGISPSLLVPVALALGLAAVSAGRLVWRARRRPALSGAPSPWGQRIVVRRVRDGEGLAFVDGAWWTVASASSPLVEGGSAEVVGRRDLCLIVEPKENAQ
jgi:membrane-bound serine protease (ClpP class)